MDVTPPSSGGKPTKGAKESLHPRRSDFSPTERTTTTPTSWDDGMAQFTTSARTILASYPGDHELTVVGQGVDAQVTDISGLPAGFSAEDKQALIDQLNQKLRAVNTQLNGHQIPTINDENSSTITVTVPVTA